MPTRNGTGQNDRNRKQAFCYRHPTKTARRRCYQCRRYICPECQVRLDRHIFCGRFCHQHWKRLEQWNSVRSFMRKHAARFIVYPMIILLSIIIPGGSYFWKKSLEKDVDEIGRFRTVVARIRPAPVSPIRITRPVFGARLSSSKIPVSGKAPPGASIRLWNNGDLVAIARADNRGYFEFTGVPLAGEGNLLQVEYELSDGQRGFAPAILVYHPVSNHDNMHYVQRSPDNLIRGNRERKEVALTFDGAHSARDVDDLLALTEKEKVPITVFLTGMFIRRFPDATRKLAHSPWIEVGNHTLDHQHLTTYAENRRQLTRSDLTPERLFYQLNETARLYLEVTGKMMVPLWRAPYGEHNLEIRSWASSQGYTHVGWTSSRGWTLDSLDWVDNPENPLYRPSHAIVQHWIKLANQPPDGINGGIFLMHLGTRRKVGDRMVDALPILIRELRKSGYRFVFVTTLLKHLRQPAVIATHTPATSARTGTSSR